MARRSTANHSPAWSGSLDVVERVLGNGLRVLILPRHHVPVVICDLYYPVGLFDEPPGKSGLAHFVEHMLFKGTKRFPKGQIDRLAFVASGQSNAETCEDLTHYWFAFPSNRWELALAIEADRMRGATFLPREVSAERRVIVEERARDAESPLVRLDSAHLTHTYIRHPYRNPILGWPDDFDSISLADLKAFYRRHYRPDGAVLVIVGDVEAHRALDEVEKWFGQIPRGNLADECRSAAIVEPRQVGRRDFTLFEAESVSRGLFGWQSVPIGHPDAPALEVLSDILTCGRRSRLWDGLVEGQKSATYVDAGQEGAKRAGQFLLQIEAMPGVDPTKIDRAILDCLHNIATAGPTAAELDRSRRRLEAAWRWEQEDLGGLAAGLGAAAIYGDWRDWQAEHRAAVSVTADEVRRVAATYLVADSLTVGWSIPRVGASPNVRLPDDAFPSSPKPAGRPPKFLKEFDLGLPARPARLIDFAPARQRLANGMSILTETRAGSGIVALELFIDAGLLREVKPGLASLTGRLLEEGTSRRTAKELAETIEDVGGAVEVGSTGVSLRIRTEDLPLAIEWLADLAIRPAFPDDSCDWIRRKMAAEIQSDRDDPAFRADLLFRGLVYGEHPYGRDPRGTARELSRLTRGDVVEHHRRYYRPERSLLVAVGDVDPAALRKLVERDFGCWAGDGVIDTPETPRLSRGSRPRSRRVEAAGEQIHVLLGHLGVARSHPDFDALAVADHILGSGPGFTDRLSRVIRDEMGLAYSVAGGMTDSADREAGLFCVSIGTGPEVVDRAVAAALDQIRLVHAGQFGDDEVARACQYLAGSWVFDFQTAEQRAERLVELEWWGLPLDEPLTWPERIGRITPRQVRDATRLHINPNALIQVEYGPLLSHDSDMNIGCA